MFGGAEREVWFQDIWFNPDRIVRIGKEAKGNQECLVRKKYDATKLSYLTAEVREDYVELITEFSHTWRRLTGILLFFKILHSA